MGRASRLFEIIQILRRATAPVPARSIAAALEVSQRTIYRDILTLEAMNVPIEGEAGLGYVLEAGFDLPPLTFTAEEVEAIVVGLSLIGRTGDEGLLSAAARVSRKISAVLPPAAERALETSPLHVSRWNAIPPAKIGYRLLRQAIREARKLRLSYADLQSRHSERTVWPLALVYYVDTIILAGWCELREDFRHFRVDRIARCAVAEGSFMDSRERPARRMAGPQKSVRGNRAVHPAMRPSQDPAFITRI